VHLRIPLTLVATALASLSIGSATFGQAPLTTGTAATTSPAAATTTTTATAKASTAAKGPARATATSQAATTAPTRATSPTTARTISLSDAQPILRGQSQPMALSDAQSLALRQNPDILQATLEVNRSTATLKSIIAQRYPKILGLAFVGQQVTENFPRDVAALPGVFQPVTQQYRLGLEVREATLGVRVSEQRLRLAKQRTVAEVKTLYLSMLALQSSVASLQTNFEFLLELERYVRAEVHRGAALPVDSMIVQARVARADFEVDKAKDDLNTMGQNLNRKLGRPPLAEVILVDEPIAPLNETNEDDQISEAMNKRPELSELRLNIHRSNLLGKVQLSGYIPDISFGATGIFSRSFDISLPRSFVGVGFLGVWEPWDWGRRIQLSKELNARMRQEKIKLKDTAEAVSIDVDKARRDLRLAAKEAKAGAMAEESTQEQLRVVHRRFIAGAALLKDVLEAQTAYTRAVAENVKAKTDIAAARVELDESLGRDF
jgi:outer membrane protein TolC